MKKIVAAFVLLMAVSISFAQTGDKTASGGSKVDSLGFEHRDDAKDSITIHYRFLDSTRSISLDTSLNDFSFYMAVPSTLQYLGNDGSAGYSLIFTPLMKAGWDDGFHQFDAYRYTLEDSKFFKTTKPLSQVAYQLASGQEQTVKVLHTQNPKPNLNFGFEYKLISAPGFFVTQNNTINSYRLFTNYQGIRKRYAAYFVLVGNTIKSSENGGMQNDSFLLNPNYSQRFTIPVNLGGTVDYAPSPFVSSVATGNMYKDFTLFLRQTYDLGKKDSIDINDSTTEYLFYPKLRFQYSLSLSSYSHQFVDAAADSSIYGPWYGIKYFPANTTNSFSIMDKWTVTTNDFSLVQFPDTKNQAEFFLAGARIENLKTTGGTLSSIMSSSIAGYQFYNIAVHAEYRNRTRNKLWEILAKGEIYLDGLNSGDYTAHATLERYLNKKLGNIRLSFDNVNRTPSFIYNPLSVFNFGNTTVYKKENITEFKATADNPFINLGATDYFITNYNYFTDYYLTAQYGKLINVLQLSASKKIKLTRYINWYTDITVQQTDPAAPIKVPLVFTRNRIAFEGTFYENLKVSTGIEFRYYTPYNEYNYSPIMGEFMPQDTVKDKNLPDICVFLHFRIKTFTAYIRADNLNSINFANGIGFTDNNFAAPHYVYPGFMFRVGVQWNFVN
jgi:hypothetical protein